MILHMKGAAESKVQSEHGCSESGSGSSSSVLCRQASKVVDASNMDIVFRGKMWDREEDPNAKSVAHLLERNESLVTWLQPRDGSVEDQIPVINVKGQYRGLSLRMQKSIWRHVRLKKGFVNLESLSQGGFKLRIPRMLLSEKEKTRNRFAQMRDKSGDSMSESGDEEVAVEKPTTHASKNKKDGAEKKKKEKSTSTVGGDAKKDKSDGASSQDADDKQKASVSVKKAKSDGSTTGSSEKNLKSDGHGSTGSISSDKKSKSDGQQKGEKLRDTSSGSIKSKEVSPNASSSSQPSSSKKRDSSAVDSSKEIADSSSKKQKKVSEPPSSSQKTSSKPVQDGKATLQKGGKKMKGEKSATCDPRVTGAGGSGCAAAARQSLCRRVQAVVTGVLIPIGKMKRDLEEEEEQGTSRNSTLQALPIMTRFVFTEDDTLRKLVESMVRDCKKLCSGERRVLIAKILGLLDDLQEDEVDKGSAAAAGRKDKNDEGGSSDGTCDQEDEDDEDEE